MQMEASICIFVYSTNLKKKQNRVQKKRPLYTFEKTKTKSEKSENVDILSQIYINSLDDKVNILFFTTFIPSRKLIKNQKKREKNTTFSYFDDQIYINNLDEK